MEYLVKQEMAVVYTVNHPVTPDQFIDVLIRSALAERRPVDDLACITGMLENSSLTVAAWYSGELVGIARSITDFHYACYLSDLAVDRAFQGRGIGLELQRLTQRNLGPRCKIILLAAPDAVDYYPHIGYARHDSCWVLDHETALR